MSPQARVSSSGCDLLCFSASFSMGRLFLLIVKDFPYSILITHYIRHSSGHFMFGTTLCPQRQPYMTVIIIPILQMGKSSLKRLNHLPEVIQLLRGAFGTLYEDCLTPKPFLPKDVVMHVALTEILNLWSWSDSVRPAGRAQVCTVTETLVAFVSAHGRS